MDMPIHERRVDEQCDHRIGLRMPALLYAKIARRALEQGLPLSTIVRKALQHDVGARP